MLNKQIKCYRLELITAKLKNFNRFFFTNPQLIFRYKVIKTLLHDERLANVMFP